MEELVGADAAGEIKKMMKKTAKTGTPPNLTVKAKLGIHIDKVSEVIVSENVLGYVEGTDAKDEVIVLTAHYDHIGLHHDKIYNGADDNASGTVALMEIAEALMLAKKDGISPKSSILIMPVSAEEKGLLGSSYYSDNPIFPMEKTVANLNIDMIGRVDEDHKKNRDYIYIIGSNFLSTELHAINETVASEYSELDLDYRFNSIDDPNRFYYRSDHYHFVKHNVPAIFYFNGTHEDYHKHTDTYEKIQFDVLEKRTRLIFLTLWAVSYTHLTLPTMRTV